MDKVIEHEEVRLNIDGIDYFVSFTSVEMWNYVDHGIGWYDYCGATGVHEDYQWDLDDVEVYDDIVIHEYLNEHEMVLDHPIDSLNKELADKLKAACIKYAKDNAEEPDHDDFDDGFEPDEEDLYPSYDPGYYPYD